MLLLPSSKSQETYVDLSSVIATKSIAARNTKALKNYSSETALSFMWPQVCWFYFDKSIRN